MSRPQWIVFDAGDVLLNWQKSASALALQFNIERDVLLDALFVHADDMLSGKISSEAGWAQILSDLHLKADPREVILSWRSRDYWFAGSLALVADLHAAGYKLAIMSNAWLGLNDSADSDKLPPEIKLFDRIFESSDVKQMKPAQGFYELVERELAAAPQDLFLIDDSLANVTTATSRGWQAYNFTSRKGHVEESVRELRDALLS